MRYSELIKLYEGALDDAGHSEALAKTGFWGEQAAGCLFMAKDTGKFLIAHRSSFVEQPNTWGTWGGAMDKGETPIEAITREAYEETGMKVSPKDIVPLFVFKDTKSSFKYHNFLVLTPTEFEPHLNWETQGFKWVRFGDWPNPIHFGIVSLLQDSKSYKKMESLSSNAGVK